MDDMIDLMIGVDKKKEIFDLWYEVTFLRYMINEILIKSEMPMLSQESVEYCRKKAQDTVKKRFPMIQIDFKEPIMDSYQNQKEESFCNLPDPQGSFPDPQNPLHES